MIRLVCIFMCSVFIILPLSAWAGGSLYFPGDPSLGGGMCSLHELYDYLTKGEYPEMPTVFREPETGPAPAMVTLAEILDEMDHLFGRCDVRPEHVLNTATFFSTDENNWGPQKGMLSRKTLSPDNPDLEAGVYDAANLTEVDNDLIAENIKKNKSIFGVQGTYDEDCPPCSGNARVGDVLIGKTFSTPAGRGRTGTMPNKGSKSIPPIFAGGDHPIPMGYYDGTGSV